MPNSYTKAADLSVTNTHLTDIKGAGFVLLDDCLEAQTNHSLFNRAVVEAIRAIDVPAIDADLTSIRNETSFNYGILAAISPLLPASGILKVQEDFETTGYLLSDDLIHSNDTEVETALLAYTKVAEIWCPLAGTMRIKFDFKAENGSYGVKAWIYKNGATHGTERLNPGTTYVEYSEDLAYTAGDLIQLYLCALDAGTKSQARNFRVYGHLRNNFENVTV